ncbi:MAG TPA: amino acid permease, partial [Bacteroidales bacterium]|nr:amino acid permease [Bacteroidales bacterium]
ILAFIIIFATANVYTTGMSRVVLSVARDGGLPKALNYIHPKSGSPTRSLVMLSGASVCMLIVYYIFDLDLQTALLIPSGAAIIVYIIGSGAGIKLLKDRGAKRYLPWISLVMSVIILPFVGILALASIGMSIIAYVYALKRTTNSSTRL